VTHYFNGTKHSMSASWASAPNTENYVPTVCPSTLICQCPVEVFWPLLTIEIYHRSTVLCDNSNQSFVGPRASNETYNRFSGFKFLRLLVILETIKSNSTVRLVLSRCFIFIKCDWWIRSIVYWSSPDVSQSPARETKRLQFVITREFCNLSTESFDIQHRERV